MKERFSRRNFLKKTGLGLTAFFGLYLNGKLRNTDSAYATNKEGSDESVSPGMVEALKIAQDLYRETRTELTEIGFTSPNPEMQLEIVGRVISQDNFDCHARVYKAGGENYIVALLKEQKKEAIILKNLSSVEQRVKVLIPISELEGGIKFVDKQGLVQAKIEDGLLYVLKDEQTIPLIGGTLTEDQLNNVYGIIFGKIELQDRGKWLKAQRHGEESLLPAFFDNLN